jgi:hypothetical protein
LSPGEKKQGQLEVVAVERSATEAALPLPSCRRRTRLLLLLFNNATCGAEAGSAAMALQLDYTGVALNHMLTGIMADSDRSRIKPLELSSVIAAALGVAEAAKFHRSLLKVPAAQPFRQCSRITVVVNDIVQAAALNGANQILHSYDIIAVRPKNQKAFNQASTHLEVKRQKR